MGHKHKVITRPERDKLKKQFGLMGDIAIRRILATLPKREAYYIELYFGTVHSALSVSEMSLFLNLSRQVIYYHLNKALRRLKHPSRNRFILNDLSRK